MTGRTIEEQGFVERSIALMLGDDSAGFSQGDSAMLRALQGSSASAIAVLPGGGALYADG